MFERFKEKVREIFRKIVLTDEDIRKLLRELRRDLVESDVDPEIASKIIDEVRSKIEKGFGRREIIWAVYETISKYVGKGEKIEVEKTPFKILLVGLFGSGKTTTAAKLAYHFKRKGYNVALVQTDNQRPASYEQLKQLGEKIKVKVYDLRKSIDGFDEISRKHEILIIDTAGRTVLDESLVREIKRIKEKISPDKILLVIPAEIGQNAKREILGFQESVGIDGIIITRMDGSAKGGGALVASYLTKSPVYFIGTGEKIKDLEEFDPKGYIGRMLGIGDIEGLIREVEEKIGKKDVEIREIDLYFIKEQIENLEKLGPLEKIFQMIPGFGLMEIERKDLYIGEEKIKKFKAIFNSLRRIEYKEPERIKKRIKKIAYGAGVSERDVLDLLNLYYQMKKIMKMMRRRDFQRMFWRYFRVR